MPKSQIRICEICGKEFRVFACYLKRLHKAGRFCSNKCHGIGVRGSANPNAGALVTYGSKVVLHARTLRRHQELRRKALDRVARVHDYSEPCCMRCNCSEYRMLQVNHLKDFKTKESGNRLHSIILSLHDDEIQDRFNILCQPCNWLDHLERKFNCQYYIEWKGLKVA